MSFTNKVVIITGGSSGIGADTAVHFAREGAQVVIVGRNEAKLKEVTARISKVGKTPLVIKADVATNDVKTIVKQTVAKFGKLDVLVNNAGVLRSAAICDENVEQVYDEVMNTNLRSIFILTNLASLYLIKSKGNIINISSIAGSSTMRAFAASGMSAYCVSKAGLIHFSQISAMELASKGVRVNIVSPGPVDTLVLENAGMDVSWDEVKEITALKTLTKPEEVADLILYLASDKAKSITGANYVIDGGYLIN